MFSLVAQTFRVATRDSPFGVGVIKRSVNTQAVIVAAQTLLPKIEAALPGLERDVVLPLHARGIRLSFAFTTSLAGRFRTLLLAASTKPDEGVVTQLAAFSSYLPPRLPDALSIAGYGASQLHAHLHSLLTQAYTFPCPVRGAGTWLDILSRFVRSRGGVLHLRCVPISDRLGENDYYDLHSALRTFSCAREVCLNTASVRTVNQLRLFVSHLNQLHHLLPRLEVLRLPDQTLRDLARFFPDQVNVPFQIKPLPPRSYESAADAEPALPRAMLMP